MALQSMTGFARAEREAPDASFSWELKSVNGKGLEIRLRLPQGMERIEQAVRAAIQRRFARGNIHATLSVTRTAGQGAPAVNREFLHEVALLAQQLSKEYGFRPASADGILALRGVLEQGETEQAPEQREAFDAELLSALDAALDDLAAMRAQEGKALSAFLLLQIDEIEVLTLRAEADPSRQADEIARRLAQQVDLLMASGKQFDADRLHAEAALLAAKADIREELDRLKTHVASARDLIASGGRAGRKLDFLAQEFNREANTLCSKSNAAAVTAIGLQMKVAVDQFREQVQNIE
ncbi:MAG: YicC/YloC family endoribonuclease [Zhengella sp.]|uniref:YicC/YloC family endoribonuclease n=1 Tax=Zhengella sp. TaxID=2282762 RepID=UPI001DB1AE6D|nr:YicC family protein [Notoacmeibacter sp.]MCC0027997.1 YicC family protein [Brucellaceae bacterium]